MRVLSCFFWIPGLLALALLVSACSLGPVTQNVTPGPSEVSVIQTPPVSETTLAPEPPVATPHSSESIPAPTPDLPGLRVVYVKEGDLWLWEGGETRQLTTGGDVYQPRSSDDGQIIAFLRPLDDFHIELWGVNADGSGERRFVDVAELDTIGGGVRDPNAVAVNPYHYAWVPGTHMLAFNTHQVFQGPGLSPLDDLNHVDVDAMQVTYLLLSGWGGDFAYSPDGSQIAITQPTSVILTNADGGDYREVFFYEPVNTYSEYRFYASPLWSPDGTFLRVAIPPKDPLARPAEPTELWTIQTGGSAPVLDGAVGAVPFFETSVAYSPDLERVIYLAEVGGPADNLRELHVTAYDGGGDWAYQKAPLLAFEGWGLDSDTFNYKTDLEGSMWFGGIDSPGAPFSDDPYGVSRIRWVDERHYLYIQETPGGFDFYLASLDGELLLLDSLSAPPPNYDFALN